MNPSTPGNQTEDLTASAAKPAPCPPPARRGFLAPPPEDCALFNCPQCNARISAPTSAFPGLCPVCRVLIEKPDSVVHSLIPVQPDTDAPAPAKGDKPHRTSGKPVARLKIVANVYGDYDKSAQNQLRMEPSGSTSFRPRALGDIPDRSPEFDREPTTVHSLVSIGKGRMSRNLRWTLAIWAGMIAVTALVYGITSHLRPEPVRVTATPSPDESIQAPPVALREELNQAAEQTFRTLITAKNPADIAKHVIGGTDRIPAIEKRFNDEVPFPSMAQYHMLSPTPMEDADIRRGICGLLYQAVPPPDLNGRQVFIPIEYRLGTTAPGLLEQAALLENISPAAPRSALALFVKTNGRLKLDWDLFIQTWDRSLAAFRDGELGEGPLRFRVIASFDTPVFENGESVSDTVVRLQDPLHSQDTIRIATNLYDGAMLDLRNAWPEGTNTPPTANQALPATVDLIRDPETGRISIDRFVCMEFLGLGGKMLASN